MNIRIPVPWVTTAVRLLGALVRPAIVDYLGDVALYTSTDKKSRHYSVRQEILAYSVA